MCGSFEALGPPAVHQHLCASGGSELVVFSYIIATFSSTETNIESSHHRDVCVRRLHEYSMCIDTTGAGNVTENVLTDRKVNSPGRTSSGPLVCSVEQNLEDGITGISQLLTD